jgi:ankyrin repeat protein
VTHLLTHGAHPDRIPVLATLLAHGADLHPLAPDYLAPSEAQFTGRNGIPLHSTAAAGNIDAANFLLERGAGPEVKNEEGCTWGNGRRGLRRGMAERFDKGTFSKVLKLVDSRGLIVT